MTRTKAAMFVSACAMFGFALMAMNASEDLTLLPIAIIFAAFGIVFAKRIFA